MSVSSLADRSLVVFNFLPSKTLHPSRSGNYGSAPYAAAMAAMPAFSGTWHRHWSRQILQQEGLLEAPVTDIAAAGLAIAVLEPGILAGLARRIGVVLCAPRLRYAISGEAVRALQAALGADVLHWARDGRTLHPGFPGPMFTNADEAVRTVNKAGYAALYCAFQSAKPEVARRFFLKLPVPGHARGPVENDATMAVDSDVAITVGGDAATSVDSEVAMAIDSEIAMALATALSVNSTVRGGNGISD